MEKGQNYLGRRKFLKQTALATSGLMVTGTSLLFSQNRNVRPTSKNIKSVGYAGINTQSPLKLWNFERRPVGDNDVLIDIKYSSICHSDIHTIKGHWGSQTFPQVPGHEMTGIVIAVGKNVTNFKIGDKAGVGVIVDSCLQCSSCKSGEEQYCEKGMVGTYGAPDPTSPTGITQGGYSNNIVVTEHFVFKIPDNLDLKYAAPLLCAGVTSFSPILQFQVKSGNKVGVAGIGGLGHLAVKLAVAKGAEVYAFTTTPSKVEDIKHFGAKEVIVVDSIDKLKPWFGKLDYMISTIPYAYDVSDYISCVKPKGYFRQVGIPTNGTLELNTFNMINNRVNYSGSLIGGTIETNEVLEFCAANKIYPEVQIIKASEVNEAWDKVINKEARYRYVIDTSTF